ncbi:endonuclease/exonuclease/phosphatase family protein [Acetobacter sp. LMG 32666]|uniref:endonuclease/exonuclease/phosphatase family protein n=1 Tax=Acetobacter sp. LMG 32666 TaxID=2959295 RepID=UPI0030C8CBA6
MALAGAGFFWASSSFAAPVQTLKISTWNMDWLLAPQAQNAPQLPPDIPHRTAQDFAALATYAQRLHPDLIGLQEVGDSATLARLFNTQDYQIFVSGDDVAQHTALAVRQGLGIRRNPDVTALALSPAATQHRLRSGLDVTILTGGTDLRILVVHFKTGCWDNPLSETHHACPILFQQFRALQDWLIQRVHNGESFAIIGDFNRRMTRTDPLFIALNQITPLDLVTAGHASPCLNGSSFIDHILLGGAAPQWKEPDSLRVMTIPQNTGTTLSDHCPVSITLHIPQHKTP